MNSLLASPLTWIAVIAAVLGTVAAVGVRVLHDFSHRELERYCHRRLRRERLDAILARHNRAALAAEHLQILALGVALIAATLALVQGAGHGSLPSLGSWWIPASVLGVFFLLIATVWLPYGLNRLWSAPLLYHTWPFWSLVDQVVRPFTSGVSLMHALMRRLAGQTESSPDEVEEAFEDEIRSIVTAGMRDGLLEEDAREMIEGVIELGDADVADIMTPRSRVDALDASLDWPQILEFVIDVGRTRIPVYEINLDNIVGVLYVKDLLPELAKPADRPKKPLRKLLRQTWFTPKTLPLDALLQEFLNTRNHLAVVVDEYNAVAGIVTIEDVLEEIVGEIVDESDKESEAEILEIDERRAEALGTTHIYDINALLGLNLPDDGDYDTIGGFVVTQLGRLPRPKESLVFEDVRIVVLRATPRRIERVRLERLDGERAPDNAQQGS